MLVVGETVLVGVLTREHAGATGSRQRVSDITVGEAHTVASDAVEVGSLHKTGVVARHHLRRVVIGHDIDDVGACRLRPQRGLHGHQEEEGSFSFHFG